MLTILPKKKEEEEKDGEEKEEDKQHGHTGSAFRKLITEFLTAIEAVASVLFRR